jgi:hypothetical protein
MLRSSVLAAALLLGGACASVDSNPVGSASAVAVKGEPVAVFMGLGGVT